VSRTLVAATRLCAPDGTFQRICADRVREGDLAVDHDHRQVDAVAPLELLVAVDRHPPEPEADPRRLALEKGERTGTEPAALALEEHDLDGARRRR
jgi:hypothetical protein